MICISNVSSPEKKNPVIQKERIKPEKEPVFLLVNSFYERGRSPCGCGMLVFPVDFFI